MAIYHCSMKNGGVGKGKSHAQYIGAEGKYAQKSDMVFCENGNLPSWANGDAVQFFKAADLHERKNGRTYKEFELSLPRELDFDQNLELVKSFMDEAKLQNQPYLLAIHAGKNGDNPHAHLMFSERPHADFSEEVFFKRNGSKKDRTFNDKSYLSESRKAWEVQINQALEQAGIYEKVSCESLKKQGIDRLPQPKIGVAAREIESRSPGESNRLKRFAEVMDKNNGNIEVKKKPVISSEIIERFAAAKKLATAEKPRGVSRVKIAKLMNSDVFDEIKQYQIDADSIRQIEDEIEELPVYKLWQMPILFFKAYRIDKKLEPVREKLEKQRDKVEKYAKQYEAKRQKKWEAGVEFGKAEIKSMSQDFGMSEYKLELEIDRVIDAQNQAQNQAQVEQEQRLKLEQEQSFKEFDKQYQRQNKPSDFGDMGM